MVISKSRDLGHPLAEWVVTFYANVKDIQFAGEITATVTTRNVSPQELDGLISLLEGTCRNALPLLEQLPPLPRRTPIRPRPLTACSTAGVENLPLASSTSVAAIGPLASLALLRVVTERFTCCCYAR